MWTMRVIRIEAMHDYASVTFETHDRWQVANEIKLYGTPAWAKQFHVGGLVDISAVPRS
jgi:hypothetical protein